MVRWKGACKSENERRSTRTTVMLRLIRTLGSPVTFGCKRRIWGVKRDDPLGRGTCRNQGLCNGSNRQTWLAFTFKNGANWWRTCMYCSRAVTPFGVGLVVGSVSGAPAYRKMAELMPEWQYSTSGKQVTCGTYLRRNLLVHCRHPEYQDRRESLRVRMRHECKGNCK